MLKLKKNNNKQRVARVSVLTRVKIILVFVKILV